jgi:hypothetical protein
MLGNLINLGFAWIAASLFVGPLAGAFLAKGLGQDEEPPEWFEPWMAEGEEPHKGSTTR